MNMMEEENGKLSVVVSSEKTENSGEKKSFWHINREMLPYKLHFILFVGGSGAVFPFQSAFGITVLGLTASNIAACYTALNVAIFVLKPGFGYIADYFNKLKAVIIGLAICQLISYFVLIIIPNTGMPGIYKMQSTNTSPNNTFRQICFNSDKFNLLDSKRYLTEENFRQISSCFNSNIIENIFINGSTVYINNKSKTLNNDSVEIKRATCNSTYTNFLLSGESFDTLYIESSERSFICLLSVERNFSYTNFSFDVLNQYCYVLSNAEIMKLKQLFDESVSITLHCNDLHKKISLQQKDEHSISIANFKTYQFWAFAICLIVSCTCGSSEFTMSDTVCYESIQGSGQSYGQQRVWGAIFWGIMAPFAGYLNDYTEGYMTSWGVYACCTALQIWNISRMNLIKPNLSQSILRDVKIILSSVEFLFFATGVLLNGMCTGIIWYYLTWFVVSIGGNKLIVGLVHTFQCYFGEVPVLYISEWLIKRFGHFNVVSLALISHGIRFFLYSYLHNPWWILPIECLHGFSFGSFYAAMTSYGKLNSKPGTEATTQSILCTMYEAFGCGIGCVVTGMCLEYFGGHTTFFYASVFCVIATMINIMFTFIIRCAKSSEDVSRSATNTGRY